VLQGRRKGLSMTIWARAGWRRSCRRAAHRAGGRVEALDVTVPRTAAFDVSGFGADGRDPLRYWCSGDIQEIVAYPSSGFEWIAEIVRDHVAKLAGSDSIS
jgi:hypothetical protein